MTSALLLLSGGQDSTTCLAWSMERFEKIYTLSFDYGQRHRVELEQAKKIADLARVPNEIFSLNLFDQLSKNALTHQDIDIAAGDEKTLPSTFVPGRNQVFLTIACMKAYQKGISHIVGGMCQTDYSGYPDCHEDFIKSIEKTSSLAMNRDFTIHTPLMNLGKAGSVKLMQKLGKLDWLAESHTCYAGERPACGKCPACELRLKGFEEAGLTDPLEYQKTPSFR